MSNSLPSSPTSSESKNSTFCQWLKDGEEQSAIWKSEKNLPVPKKILMGDDTLPADQAYRLMSEGTYLVWNSDFHNAKQLMQAIARRIDKPSKSKKNKTNPSSRSNSSPAELFHLHRQAQSHRARILGMLLIPMNSEYKIDLGRAPDVNQACTEAWGNLQGEVITPLRELLGIISAHEWRKKGVEIPALGNPPNNRIYPHYGVFSPIRGEYINLVAQAPTPPKNPHKKMVAFDIGTGTGVLTAILAKRGFNHVIGTDQSQRAIDCALDNLSRLNLLNLDSVKVEIIKADLFPEGLASLIVCNPPWLPGRASSSIDHAIYDENNKMLLGFLNGLAQHLEPEGEGWLIMSDLAEHLGLRTHSELLEAIQKANLSVVGKLQTKPHHPKSQDQNDPLHFARAAEVTTLWRLARAS